MGRLAAKRVGVSTENNVYTPPTSKTGVFTVSICNINSSAIKFKLALQTNSTDAIPSAGEYIEYDFELEANNTYERSGIVLTNPQTLTVLPTTSVDVVVWGFEE